MDNYHVNVTDTAFEDLESIALYIKDELKEPDLAVKLVLELKKSIFSLDALPLRHALVNDKAIAGQGYRGFLVGNYIIFYTVSEYSKTVDISRILYVRRNWEKLL